MSVGNWSGGEASALEDKQHEFLLSKQRNYMVTFVDLHVMVLSMSFRKGVWCHVSYVYEFSIYSVSFSIYSIIGQTVHTNNVEIFV